MTPPDRDPTAEAAPPVRTEILSRDNPQSRWHTEDRRGGSHSWACIPLVAAIEAGALDAAWQRAEAAGEYWRVRSLTEVQPFGGWEAVASDGHRIQVGRGPDAAAALLNLAEKLEAHRG